MTKQTINKAYQTLLRRINSESKFDGYYGNYSSFWNSAQPAFERIRRITSGNVDRRGLIKLSLVFQSKTGYDASICDINERAIVCILDNNSFDKITPWLKGWSTMRQCKANLSSDDFKRIWLMTAISCGKDLYKLGHNGTPFIKAGETIESLAIEYDLFGQKVDKA